MSLSFILLCLPIGMKAQTIFDELAVSNDSIAKENTEKFVPVSVLQEYIDSLSVLKEKLEAERNRNISNYNFSISQPLDGRYASLFLPLNYDRQLAYRRFTTDRDEEIYSKQRYSMDDALFALYLNNPDLILGAMKNRKEKKEDSDAVPYVPKADNVLPAAPKADEVAATPMKLVITKPNFWAFNGDYTMQFMQNSYSKNWYQGGENNYSTRGKLTLRANYNNKQKVKFENTLEMELGFRTNSSDTVHSVKTSSDLLRYTGKLGLQATKKWYYTLQVVANSQFCRSFGNNSNVVNSDFLSPANVNVSLGMDYTMNWFKKKLNGTIHLAPLALNYKYCDRDALVTKHGIEQGKHSLLDYGSTFQVTAAWKFSDNVSWNTRLYGYTTYKRVDLQWENTVKLRVSKYITAEIYFYPRFDDQSVSRKDKELGYFQIKEYTSLGFNYSF